MQEKIPVNVCGDYWLDRDELENQLYQHNNDKRVVLDMRSEGASLQVLGILDVVNNWCRNTGRDPETVLIDCWPNTVETIPFSRAFRPRISHFFWLSDRYRPDQIIEPTHQYQFGYFMGRQTLPRRRIMWDMYHIHKEQTLMSVMKGSIGLSPSIDSDSDWLPDGPEQFDQWFCNPPVGSIDGNTIQDQYCDGKNTNLDLLGVYNQFDIEIVAESYTQGSAFFPTEKTIRPLVAGRPFLLYGPVDYMKNLRELGFQTWDDIWSEAYDHYQGYDRWRYIKSVVDVISQQDPKELWQACREICEHNHNLVKDLANRYRPGQ